MLSDSKPWPCCKRVFLWFKLVGTGSHLLVILPAWTTSGCCCCPPAVFSSFSKISQIRGKTLQCDTINTATTGFIVCDQLIRLRCRRCLETFLFISVCVLCWWIVVSFGELVYRTIRSCLCLYRLVSVLWDETPGPEPAETLHRATRVVDVVHRDTRR